MLVTAGCVSRPANTVAAGNRPAASTLPAGYLAVSANQYQDVFDAAGEVARSYGLVPALRDRRAGIIETEPAFAASLFEPHRRATSSLEQAVASTLSFQRRRARFEFQPAGFDASTAPAPGSAGAEGDSDRTHWDALGGDLELRVWVYNERAHIPGIRRSAWSRRLTTRATVIDPETGHREEAVWMVVSRDRALEERLLAQVARQMGR